MHTEFLNKKFNALLVLDVYMIVFVISNWGHIKYKITHLSQASQAPALAKDKLGILYG